ncbi:protein starmaker-like isoform X3 [Macrobrachium nipponense]|uniref:protein starmaker-like isoform X3 n=1 Tax=Macrobrachium nipponense TaxID=159736 RepID=UPI0030C8D064
MFIRMVHIDYVCLGPSISSDFICDIQPLRSLVHRNSQQNMGGSLGKEALQLVPMVLSTLPTLIEAFQTTKSSGKSKEDDRIAEVLEVLQGNRRDIDQMMQDQARRDQGYQALITLMNRAVERVPEQQQGGAIGQGPKIRIEMDLPENIEDHGRALQNFVATLGRFANAYNQEQGIRLADEPMDRDVVCYESRGLMSAPPFPSDELEKKKKRNAKCENFDDDDCKRNWSDNSSDCSRRRNFGDSDCDMTYEEQVQIATQMSLEYYQQKQADEDFLLARRLQEEEDRLMRFRQHEDFSQKSHVGEGRELESGRVRTNSSRTSLHESSRRNSGRCSGGCYDEEEMTRGAREKSYHDYHSDEQIYDDDDASAPQLSPRAGVYNEAQQMLHEAVNSGDCGYEKSFSNTSSQDRLDDYEFDDSRDRNSDREMSLQESPRRNLNRQTATSSHNEETPVGRINYLDDEDDEDSHCDEKAYKGRIDVPDDEDDDDEECCRLSSNQGIYTSAQQELEDCRDGDDDDDNCKASKTRNEDTCKEDGYEREKTAMLIRAMATYEEDKEKRRKKRLLREQEELELALALSLSIQPQHERGQTDLGRTGLRVSS